MEGITTGMYKGRRELKQGVRFHPSQYNHIQNNKHRIKIAACMALTVLCICIIVIAVVVNKSTEGKKKYYNN